MFLIIGIEHTMDLKLTRVQVIDRELSFGLSVCGPSAPVADHMLVMAGHRYSGLESWDLC